jgi:cardiolipin synthase A/B
MPKRLPPTNNYVKLLHLGAQFHPALLDAIAKAKHEILLETYIFAPDQVGDAIQQALQNAARRGVRVRIILDWHGTGRSRVNDLRRAFHEAGAEYRSFNPWFWHGFTRSHRKLCLIDGNIAFVGGMNLNDDWLCDFDPALRLNAPRWDFTAQIEGPLVETIQLNMQLQWAKLNKMNFLERRKLSRKLSLQLHHANTDTNRPPALTSFAVRDNWRNRRTIQRAYLNAIGNARHSILLATPYFAPGRKFKRALALAAERGVQVTLLLGSGQFPLQDAVARAFYPRLLKSGVKLIEYHHTQLHGKVAVIDDQWATVGSSNCDGLSLFLNQEANIIISDTAFSLDLRQHIQQAMADGNPVTLDDFALIPWYRRAGYEFSFWVYQGLMRIVTLGEYA